MNEQNLVILTARTLRDVTLFPGGDFAFNLFYSARPGAIILMCAPFVTTQPQRLEGSKKHKE